MDRYQAMSEAMVRDGVEKIDLTNEDELAKAIAKGMDEGDDVQSECRICFEPLESELTIISACDHIMHKECAQMYLRAAIDKQTLPLVCPNHECMIDIVPQDLEKLLKKEELEKYHKYSLNTALNSSNEYSWCPTPNCTNVFIFEPDAVNGYDFDCSHCHNRYCLKCRVPFHMELTCEQY
jgi:hypothetical protein